MFPCGFSFRCMYVRKWTSYTLLLRVDRVPGSPWLTYSTHNVTVLLVDAEGPSHAVGGVSLAEPGGGARA